MSRKPVTAYEHWVQQGQPGTFAEWARLSAPELASGTATNAVRKAAQSYRPMSPPELEPECKYNGLAPGAFETGRSASWRDSLDAEGRPTHAPERCDHGCQYCFGPLDAKPGVGQYECPWCIARFPATPELRSDSPPSPSLSPAVPLGPTVPPPDSTGAGAEGEPSPAAALYRGALAAAYGPQVLGLHGQWGPLGWFDV